LKFSALTSAIVLIACTLATLGLWAILNQPSREPKWPKIVQGFAVSPYLAHQDPTAGDLPSVEQIASDLDLLKGKAHAIRTYSVEGPFAEVPRLAAERDLNVMVGAWLDTRIYNNDKEIAGLINLANQKNVVHCCAAI
jgi:exo-beta-1,3-glucanase (GH17 family)